MLARLTQLFPIWAVALSVIAYLQPQLFMPARGAIVPLPGLVMFGMGMTVTAAVMLHNFVGLGTGYGCSRLLGCDRREARTIAIEVGMQNSGLGVALAVKYFSAVAAVPGALFSVWHNLSGSVLAGWWSRREAGSRYDREAS